MVHCAQCIIMVFAPPFSALRLVQQQMSSQPTQLSETSSNKRNRHPIPIRFYWKSNHTDNLFPYLLDHGCYIAQPVLPRRQVPDCLHCRHRFPSLSHRAPQVQSEPNRYQVLRDLLSHDGLVLVAKRDLSELISNRDDDKIDSFQTPFTADLPDVYDSLGEFMDAAKSRQHGDINHKSFVILDETTAEDGKTCQIAVDGREDEQSNEIQIAFRCELASATHGLAAMEAASENELTKVIRDLRNEAAMVGGVWSKQRVDEFRSRPKRIDVGDYPPHENWDEGSGPENPDTDIPYFPIFQTAEISLEVSCWHIHHHRSLADWDNSLDSKPIPQRDV